MGGAERFAAKSERRPSADIAREEGRSVSSICIRSAYDRHRSKADAVRRSPRRTAGPIRGVAARTCVLLPAAARVAEILHPSLDLSERIGRLVVRLTYGVSGAVVDLAREIGAELLRGDYYRLERANLVEPQAIESASDEVILRCIDGSGDKLKRVREGAERAAQRRARLEQGQRPVLEAYVA